MTRPFQNPLEMQAEIEDRLWHKGIRRCALQCGTCDMCRHYRRIYNTTQAGIISATVGQPQRAGEAAMARMGYHKDGRSRHAAMIGRRSQEARAKRRAEQELSTKPPVARPPRRR